MITPIKPGVNSFQKGNYGGDQIMVLSDKIRSLRNNKSLTQQQLSELLGVSVMTVRCWEAGTKSPPFSALVSLTKVFNVSADYLIGNSNASSDVIQPLTANEMQFLSDFRSLDSHGKKAVRAIIRIEKERLSDERNERQAKVLRFIPKYLSTSAAGPAFPIDNEMFEMVPVADDVPHDADFAVVISGDSMEPRIHDGDIVYVQRNCELRVGDIGIFTVDGAMYCKQYCIDENRNVTLISVNPDRQDANVYIPCDSDLTLRCFGRVLL